MSASTDQLQATVDALQARLDRLEATSKAAGPIAFARRLAQEREEALDQKVRGIAKHPDLKERARQIAGLPDDERRKALQTMTLDEQSATLDAGSYSERRLLTSVMSEAWELDLIRHRSVPPPRVRISLRAGIDKIETDQIYEGSGPVVMLQPTAEPVPTVVLEANASGYGVVTDEHSLPFTIKNGRYSGYRVDRRTGCGWHVLTVATWEMLLARDPQLADHLARGSLIVEPVSVEESKRLQMFELKKLARNQRPRLV